jgi:hypothetical protein
VKRTYGGAGGVLENPSDRSDRTFRQMAYRTVPVLRAPKLPPARPRVPHPDAAGEGAVAEIFPEPKYATAIRVKHQNTKMFVFCRLQI